MTDHAHKAAERITGRFMSRYPPADKKDVEDIIQSAIDVATAELRAEIERLQKYNLELRKTVSNYQRDSLHEDDQ
jgi:hypothetical protein